MIEELDKQKRAATITPVLRRDTDEARRAADEIAAAAEHKLPPPPPPPPVGGSTPLPPSPSVAGAAENTALLAQDVTRDFRTRWDSIQAAFVDNPRTAVQNADSLVSDAIKRLAESFAQERARLEGQWDRGGDVSTEDLRVALQRYRSFFQRLLSV